MVFWGCIVFLGVGGMRGFLGRGHAWFFGGCIVFLGVGGMRGFSGGHAWFFQGGGMCGFFDEIRSMSGRYTSYWNAFLFYLFSHIRSFQGLFYNYELNANGFYLLLYIKISRDMYQKVCFGNNTYSGILTDFYHSFFLGVVPTMNNMQSKRQCNKVST